MPNYYYLYYSLNIYTPSNKNKWHFYILFLNNFEYCSKLFKIVQNYLKV